MSVPVSHGSLPSVATQPLAEPLTNLNAQALRAVMYAFQGALATNQQALNNLNVYPVPDGDTGTNMMLTMTSVADAVKQLPETAAMAEVCQAVSHSALMGARGNSGVILSQILRGLCLTLRDETEVSASVLAKALTAASTAAYGAVMKPIEGTILTVARCAAEGATDQSKQSNATLLVVAQAARTKAAIGLAQTPDLLPVLKAAGVVDSGGSGYLLLLDALLFVVNGHRSRSWRSVLRPATLQFRLAVLVMAPLDSMGGSPRTFPSFVTK